MSSETYRLAIPAERTAGEQAKSKVTDISIFNNCMISYGLPFQEAVAKHVEHTFHASRAYILCSRTLANTTSALKDLQAALGERVVGVKTGLKAHTSWDDVLSLKRECEQANVDVIITLGGGTLSDAAKLLTLILANDVQSPEDFHTKLNVIKAEMFVAGRPPFTAAPPTVPVICVPTTLSAGEYTFAAGATEDSTNKKYQFFTGAGIRLLVLDAALAARTTPVHLWVESGFRAVDHATEAYVSTQSNAASEAHAVAALTTLIPALLRTRADKDSADVDARHVAQMGAIEAIASIFRVYTPAGGSHAIGHMLGPFGVGHGSTSAILLPAVCAYNAKHGANGARQQALADKLWEVEEVRALGTKHGLAQGGDLSSLLRALTRELGLPVSLKEAGIGKDQVDKIAEYGLLDPWMGFNPVPLKEKSQVLELLQPIVE